MSKTQTEVSDNSPISIYVLKTSAVNPMRGVFVVDKYHINSSVCFDYFFQTYLFELHSYSFECIVVQILMCLTLTFL